MFIYLAVILTLLLAACSSDNPTPTPGQWQQNCNATISGNVITFPTSPPGACYAWTSLPVVPKVGQTLTLNYSVTGNSPVWVQNGANSGNPQADINPPTIHLLLYRNGDNGSCAGAYNFYRLFASKTALVLGNNQTVSTLLDSTKWVGCYGAVDAASFAGTLGDLRGAGVTFGGQYFAGHGVYVSQGTASFKINSLTAQ